jgi:hypothetical protein
MPNQLLKLKSGPIKQYADAHSYMGKHSHARIFLGQRFPSRRRRSRRAPMGKLNTRSISSNNSYAQKNHTQQGRGGGAVTFSGGDGLRPAIVLLRCPVPAARHRLE